MDASSMKGDKDKDRTWEGLALYNLEEPLPKVREENEASEFEDVERKEAVNILEQWDLGRNTNLSFQHKQAWGQGQASTSGASGDGGAGTSATVSKAASRWRRATKHASSLKDARAAAVAPAKGILQKPSPTKTRQALAGLEDTTNEIPVDEDNDAEVMALLAASKAQLQRDMEAAADSSKPAAGVHIALPSVEDSSQMHGAGEAPKALSVSVYKPQKDSKSRWRQLSTITKVLPQAVRVGEKKSGVEEPVEEVSEGPKKVSRWKSAKLRLNAMRAFGGTIADKKTVTIVEPSEEEQPPTPTKSKSKWKVAKQRMQIMRAFGGDKFKFGEEKPKQEQSLSIQAVVRAATGAAHWRVRTAARWLPSLMAFVPKMLQEEVAQAAKSLKENNTDIAGMLEPKMSTFQGCMLIADITGFTPLTEKLSKNGTSGVEVLTKCMNSYFTKVIDLVDAYHGDVIKFAGDALIIAFVPLQEENKEHDGGIRSTTLRAVHCASDLALSLGTCRMLTDGTVVPIPLEKREPRKQEKKPEAQPVQAALEVKKVQPGKVSWRRASMRYNMVRTFASGFNFWGRKPEEEKKSDVMLEAELPAEGGDMTEEMERKSFKARQSWIKGTRKIQYIRAFGFKFWRAAPEDSSSQAKSRWVRVKQRIRVIRAFMSAGGTTQAEDADGDSPKRGAGGFFQGQGDDDDDEGRPSHSSAGELASDEHNATGSWSRDRPGRRFSLFALAGSIRRKSKSKYAKSDTEGDSFRRPPAEAAFLTRAATTGHSAGNDDSDGERGAQTDGDVNPRLDRSKTEKLVREEAKDKRKGRKSTGQIKQRRTSLQDLLAQDSQSRQMRERITSSILQDASAQNVEGLLSQPRPPSLFRQESRKFKRKGSTGDKKQGEREARRSKEKEQRKSNFFMGLKQASIVYERPPSLQTVSQVEREGRDRARSTPGGVEEEGSFADSQGGSPAASSPGARSLLADLDQSPLPSENAKGEDSASSSPEKPRELSASGRGLLPSSRLSQGSPAGAATPPTPARPATEPSPDHLPKLQEFLTAQDSVESIGQLKERAGGRSSLASKRLAESASITLTPPPVTSGSRTSDPPSPETDSELPGSLSSNKPHLPKLNIHSASPQDPSASVLTPPPLPDISAGNGDGQFSQVQRPPIGSLTMALGTKSGSASAASPFVGESTSILAGSTTGPLLQTPPKPSGSPDLAMLGQPVAESFFSSLSGKVAAEPTTPKLERTISQKRWTKGLAFSFGLRALGAGASKKKEELEVKKADDDEIFLSLKITVGAGKLCSYLVGGVQDDSSGVPRWEFFVGDAPHEKQVADGECQPIEQIANAESLAEAGDVIMSKEVYKMVMGHCDAEEMSTGSRLIQMHMRLEMGQLAGPRRTPSGTESKAAIQDKPQTSMLWSLPRTLQARAAQMIRQHVLQNVRQRIEAGHKDFVNEIRVCTVLFIGLGSLQEVLSEEQVADRAEKRRKGREKAAAAATEPSAKQDDQALKVKENLNDVQLAMATVQKKMAKYDGSLLQFRMDEKGFLMICAFGLPGKTHEDGPVRGVRAALSIRNTLKSEGQKVYIGVTTGQLFCACVGSSTRAEYTVFGDAINLSARLMCKAKAGLGEILCDHLTYEFTKRRFRYRELEPLKVKGKAKVVIVHKLLMPISRSLSLGDSQTSSTNLKTDSSADLLNKPIVGRKEQTEIMEGLFNAVARGEKGYLVVLEGDAGMGKSMLVSHVRNKLAKSEQGHLMPTVLTGKASVYNLSQALAPFRQMFFTLFQRDRQGKMAARSAPTTDISDSEVKDLTSTDDSARAESASAAAANKPEPEKKDTSSGYAEAKAEEESSSLALAIAVLMPDFNRWRPLLADALDISLNQIPVAASSHEATDWKVYRHGSNDNSPKGLGLPPRPTAVRRKSGQRSMVRRSSSFSETLSAKYRHSSMKYSFSSKTPSLNDNRSFEKQASEGDNMSVVSSNVSGSTLVDETGNSSEQDCISNDSAFDRTHLGLIPHTEGHQLLSSNASSITSQASDSASIIPGPAAPTIAPAPPGSAPPAGPSGEVKAEGGEQARAAPSTGGEPSTSTSASESAAGGESAAGAQGTPLLPRALTADGVGESGAGGAGREGLRGELTHSQSDKTSDRTLARSKSDVTNVSAQVSSLGERTSPQRLPRVPSQETSLGKIDVSMQEGPSMRGEGSKAGTSSAENLEDSAGAYASNRPPIQASDVDSATVAGTSKGEAEVPRLKGRAAAAVSRPEESDEEDAKRARFKGKIYAQRSLREKPLGAGADAEKWGLAMSPGLKALRVRDILVVLLNAASPLILILEDAQNFDSLTWQLLHTVCEECPRVGIVLTTRPLITGENAVATQTINALRLKPSTKTVPIKALDIEETTELVSRHLNLDLETEDVPEGLVNMLYSKTRGHPLYMVEILTYISDQQKQQEHEEGDELTKQGTPNQGATSAGALSSWLRNRVNITSVITARIDKLPPTQQLTLKVASVLGERIVTKWLHAIHPMLQSTQGLTIESLERDLKDLCTKQYLTEDPSLPNQVFHFESVILRDMAYELIPFSQRRLLHAKLADELVLQNQQHEQGITARSAGSDTDRPQGVGRVPYDTISYHYNQAAGTMADEDQMNYAYRTLDFLEVAAGESLKRDAHEEVIRLYNKAQKLASNIIEKVGPEKEPVAAPRMASWQRIIAEQYVTHGGPDDTDMALAHFFAAIHHLGSSDQDDIMRALRKYRYINTFGHAAIFCCVYDTFKPYDHDFLLEVALVIKLVLVFAKMFPNDFDTWHTFGIQLCKYYSHGRSPAQSSALGEVYRELLRSSKEGVAAVIEDPDGDDSEDELTKADEASGSDLEDTDGGPAAKDSGSSYSSGIRSTADLDEPPEDPLPDAEDPATKDEPQEENPPPAEAAKSS